MMIATDMPAEVLDRLEMSVSGAGAVRVTRACSISTTVIVPVSDVHCVLTWLVCRDY